MFEKEVVVLKARCPGVLIAAAFMLSVLVGSIKVYADDLRIPDNETTGSTPTSFVVTNDMLISNDLVVSIPSELVLTYDESANIFTRRDYVTASGSLKSSKRLEVSIPTTITYQHTSLSGVTVTGFLDFGSASGGRGIEYWTPSQVQNDDSRSICSTVDADNLEYAGRYKATITYRILIKDR